MLNFQIISTTFQKCRSLKSCLCEIKTHKEYTSLAAAVLWLKLSRIDFRSRLEAALCRLTNSCKNTLTSSMRGTRGVDPLWRLRTMIQNLRAKSHQRPIQLSRTHRLAEADPHPQVLHYVLSKPMWVSLLTNRQRITSVRSSEHSPSSLSRARNSASNWSNQFQGPSQSTSEALPRSQKSQKEVYLKLREPEKAPT